MRRLIYYSFVLFVLLFVGCSFIIDTGNVGSIKLFLTSGQMNKVLKSCDSDSSLRKVHCKIKRHGIACFDGELEQDGDYFKARIDNLNVDSGYEILLFGYGNTSICDVCSYKGGITVEKGNITSVMMKWEKFVSELISPINGEEIDSSVICFLWKKVDCASDYYLQVDDDSLFVSPSVSIQLRDTSYNWKIISGKKTYYWRVVCQSGNSNGEWSETGCFLYVPTS